MIRLKSLKKYVCIFENLFLVTLQGFYLHLIIEILNQMNNFMGSCLFLLISGKYTVILNTE